MSRKVACVKRDADTDSKMSVEFSNVHSPASDARYGTAAIALHWITFLLVVVVGVLGLLHDSWPRQTQAFWIDVHAMIGMLLWVLILWRLGLRMRHASPPLPADSTAMSRRLAPIVQWLLYALLLVTPILGAVTFIWHGRIFDFGLFQVNPHVAKNPAVFEPTEDIHGYLAYAIFALAAAHAAAALWHHFVRHDAVLRRMWPARATAQSAPSAAGNRPLD